MLKPAWAGDAAIKDFAAVGLPAPSIIRTAKIATLREDRILGRVGRLANTECKLVTAALGKWFEV